MLAAQDPMGQRELDLGVLRDQSHITSVNNNNNNKKQRAFACRQFRNPQLKVWERNLESHQAALCQSGARGRAANAKWPETHVELLDGGPATLVGGDHLNLHDLNGVGAGAVPGAHVAVCRGGRDGRLGRRQKVGDGGVGSALTALGDGSGGGEVPVLAVHVVRAAARVVTKPDAKVLHLQGRLLVDLHSHDIAFKS